jgi:phage terminase large subunit GpA-like protein
MATPWTNRERLAARPPPKLSLSEWADAHFRLSAESAAEPGRWRTLPYQRGILDAITDPLIERVSVMKSARVGYTKSMNAAIAFFMAQDPCPILVVQPTIENAKIYSKEEIAPMLRDVEVLAGLVSETSVKTSDNTVLHKTFPGGLLSMVGANSGRGFRMVSRRIVIFDEVDAYPPSAGSEGDPIKLGEKRAEYYWNRKIIAGSTPLVAGSSRIEELFEAGDRRRYHVPCPHCGHMDFLRFSARNDDELGGGHVMRWPKDQPESAHFICQKCGCQIEEEHKRAMIDAGQWRAEAPTVGHASFHIWAAYSLSPNATWGQLATEFLESKSSPEKLRTFVNTALGETWKERGDAPDWDRLHARAEDYPIGTVPPGPIVLTAGVDVQKDRLVYEVVGWSPSKESWSIDAGILWGDTAIEETWLQLDALLAREYPRDGAPSMSISMLAVDAGYNTQIVYGWARQHPMTRVIACKGVSGLRALVGGVSPVDVTIRGKKLARGYKVWPVGVDAAKSELYGWLGMSRSEGDPPPGWCHFPTHGEDYFQQLTAEHLVTAVNRRTHRAKMEWQVLPNRENHYLDCRIYARAAANVLGIDRMASAARGATPPPPPSTPIAPPPSQIEHPASSLPSASQPRGGWLGSGGPRRPGRGWLGKR